MMFREQNRALLHLRVPAQKRWGGEKTRHALQLSPWPPTEGLGDGKTEMNQAVALVTTMSTTP